MPASNLKKRLLTSVKKLVRNKMCGHRIYGCGRISVDYQEDSTIQLAELRSVSVKPCNSVQLGALVDLLISPSDTTKMSFDRRVFILPVCDGQKILLHNITVTTPSAPLVCALWGKAVGDTVPVTITKRGSVVNSFEATVLAVA